MLRSPYDVEARTGKKRDLRWFGYKVHVSETRDASPDVPHLIVQVQTTVGNVQDVEVTAAIQQALAQTDRLPQEQFLDTGYVDVELLVSSRQDSGITLVGPVLSDNSWQAKAGNGFDAAHFQIDWQATCATCPQGQQSSRWTPLHDPDRIEIVFAHTTCAACPCRSECTRSQTTGRVLHVRPQKPQEALLTRRQEQERPTFRQHYATRGH